MTNNERADIIQQIRKLAGKLGEDMTLEPNTPDAEEYEHQVQCGLAEAVDEILQAGPGILSYWFGFLIIQLGLEIDDRLRALLDALENEISRQLDKLPDPDAAD